MEAAPLPPPPVDDSQPELEADEHDPLSQLVEPELLERDISKVTRILADQAGLGAAHKSRRLGVTLLAVFGVVGLLGGFVWLAASQGWFSAIGIGKPRQPLKEEKRISIKDIKLSPEEARRLRRILLQGNAKRRQPVNGRKTAGRRVQQTVELTRQERELLEFYRAQEQQKEEVAPLATRNPLAAAGPASVEIGGGYDVSGSLDAPFDASKPEVVPESRGRMPLLQGLSELHIKLVVNAHMKRIRRCFERQLKRDPRVNGKMTILALVVPSGEVKKVQIKEEKFRGTIVEECLLKEVAGWRFPAFQGEPYELSFPLLLSPRGGY
ncbi:MAG: hypothetical protein D6806_18455 [Deltaproteobacteria bacterium]|nr:MAG: hypothetical protein D6806_18455 [Deltaproteobacteria bacterium]